MDAINNPVKRSKREAHTDDFEIGQRPPMLLSDDEQIERGGQIESIDTPIHKEYLDALAFNEESITIALSPTAEKHAPKHVQCLVNGKGAEILVDGKWVSFGWLPVGQPVITKRKYVEVLIRSKPESINTRHEDAGAENPNNWLDRSASAKHPLTIIHDANPRSMDWLSRLYSEF